MSTPFSRKEFGAKDIGYQFQIVAAPIEDSSLVPRTPPIRQVTSCTSSFKRFDNLFWPLGASGHTWCRYINTDPHTFTRGGWGQREERKEANKLRNC